MVRCDNFYGYLKSGHEASLVRIETFIPYFETDLFVIDHHNGDMYIWNSERCTTEPLALQASTAPLFIGCSENAQSNCHQCPLVGSANKVQFSDFIMSIIQSIVMSILQSLLKSIINSIRLISTVRDTTKVKE